MEVYQKITDYIGNTPLLELSGMEKKYGLQAKLYGKLEYCNPAGSIKDRVAKAMLDDAEAKGILTQTALSSSRQAVTLGSVSQPWQQHVAIV